MKINEKIEGGNAFALPRHLIRVVSSKPDGQRSYHTLKQYIRVIKLTMLIMTVCLLQVSALTKAQITIKANNQPLQKVLETISKQSGYDFAYATADLKNLNAKHIDLKNATIEQALAATFSGQPLQYEIADKTVMVKRKAELSFIEKIINRLQAIDVTGRVVDENGQPIAGATIKLKGSSIAAASNSEGVFLLKNVEENATLEISYLGYQVKEVKASKDLGSIKMELSIGKLEEVTINAGYYSIKDSERTGNISRISGENIANQPVNNPLMALQSRIPGLQISQQTGMPGGGFNVLIRGRSSANKIIGNDPLYIVDGIIYPSQKISGTNTSGIFNSASGLQNAGASPMVTIDPNTIESIEVLKDADATSIYGSRGANGVVLITTKRSKLGNEKVNINISQGYGQVGHKLDLLNTEEYLVMRNEAIKNDKLSAGASDYDINGIWDSKKYTNWQDKFIGGNAMVTNANVNITGGTEKNSYLLGASYYNEGTVFPGDFGIQRINIRSSINIGTLKDRFNMVFNSNYSNLDQKLFNTDLTSYIFLAPNAPDLYDEFGKLNYSNNTLRLNPFALLNQNNNARMGNLNANVNLNYRIFSDLNFKALIGYSTIRRDEFLKFPLDSYSPALNFTSLQRTSRFSNNYNTNLQFEPQISYNLKLGKGKLTTLIGLSLQANSYQFQTIQAADYSSDELMGDISGAASLTKDDVKFSQYRYIGSFARLNYNIQDKYFLNLTGRRDGSSRFGSDKQFANFGAVGAAWIFSNTSFFKEKLSFLSYGKLRASYGTTGNDQIGDYGYLQLWGSTAPFQSKTTIAPGNRAPNPDFAWERNNKAEIALQLGFIKDRINLETSYYENRSKNQLLDQILPLSTGLSSVFANLPAEVLNTGIEFASVVKIVEARDWSWILNFNLTIPKNKLISYPNLATSANAIDYQLGKPLDILKVYNVTVDSQTGLYKIEDNNGNGRVDDGDRYISKFLGQSYYGGLQQNIRYKNFNLDFLVAFAKQNGKDYRSYSPLNAGRWLPTNQLTNQVSEVLSRWQNPNDITYVQRFGTTSITNTPNSSTRNFGSLSVVDASFIRLKNVAFSYNIPQKFISKLNLKTASINIQGQNIFTITDYIGLDPETQNLNTLPPLRTFIVGLNLTF